MTTKKINSTLDKLGDFLRRLFCVPKCASCGQRLPVFANADNRGHGIPCFCDKCLSSWSKEKTELCHSCGNTAARCTCMPNGCKLAQSTVPSLFFYHPNKKCAASNAIFTLKHKKHTDLYMFLCDELSDEIGDVLRRSGTLPSSCIFTYIPRSRKSIGKYGFDQSLLLSRMICKRLDGADSLSLISRNGGKEQKKLSPKERKKNADKSFFVEPSVLASKGKEGKYSLSQKTVILIDDIMTSGASASRCVKLLLDAGAEKVIFASVARCEIKKKSS